jgi:hypothetical protein
MIHCGECPQRRKGRPVSTQDNSPYTLSDEAWQAFGEAIAPVDRSTAHTDAYRPAVEAAARVMLRALQAQIEDAGVRGSRSNGWCAEFSRIMWRAFPAGPLDGTEWRDSDGVDCRGDAWRDSDGYDRAGFNRNGYDRDGFDRDGCNAAGLDREGKDVDGFTLDDPARYRYRWIDYSGLYAVDGFNPDGFAFGNLTRQILAGWATEAAGPDSPFKYDRDGFDRDGYHCRTGLDRAGFNRDGLDRNGRDRDGYDRRGFLRQSAGGTHRNGTLYDDLGFNRAGYHQETGGVYDSAGRDCNGRDPAGYDRDGFDSAGYDRRGHYRPTSTTVTA